jgi:hypothetical protein
MNGNTCSHKNQVEYVHFNEDGIYKSCLDCIKNNDVYINVGDVLEIIGKLKHQREFYAAQMLCFQKNILEMIEKQEKILEVSGLTRFEGKLY